MLTDFDLSKQSFPPGPPAIVKSNSPNIVNMIHVLLFYMHTKNKNKKCSHPPLILEHV